MTFIKHSEGQIANIIESNDDIDHEKTIKGLKAAKEEAKNLTKDGYEAGNKTELNKAE